MKVAEKYGMIMPGEDSTKAVRAVFVIDQKGTIRDHLLPLSLGRNFDELKRVIVALQAADALEVATPADWRPGDRVIVPPAPAVPPRSAWTVRSEGSSASTGSSAPRGLQRGTGLRRHQNSAHARCRRGHPGGIVASGFGSRCASLSNLGHRGRRPCRSPSWPRSTLSEEHRCYRSRCRRRCSASCLPVVVEQRFAPGRAPDAL